jgi:hypothetical protein
MYKIEDLRVYDTGEDFLYGGQVKTIEEVGGGLVHICFRYAPRNRDACGFAAKDVGIQIGQLVFLHEVMAEDIKDDSQHMMHSRARVIITSDEADAMAKDGRFILCE